MAETTTTTTTRAYGTQVITKVRKVVSIYDEEYFCNRSWTLSFNLNTKSWISFHSYIPNWYIGENNFFYSGLNTCCDDFDFIAATFISTTTTTTTIIICDLYAVVVDPYGTTTSTTTRPCSVTIELDGIECADTTTTTTLQPTTTTTTTLSLTTTTTTVEPTTTTTTTTVPALELTFDDIANVPVADAYSVSDWNTFFDLPVNGNPFTSVEVEEPWVSKIGFYYNYFVGVDSKLIANSGYKMPSENDFTELINYVGSGVAAIKLREVGTEFWINDLGTDDYGFKARGSGAVDTMSGAPFPWAWGNYKTACHLWTTNEIYDDLNEVFLGVEFRLDNGPHVTFPYHFKEDGACIRLLKENLTAEDLLKGDGERCDDYIGNDLMVYETVKIGNQVWVIGNLCETKFRNGDYIPGFDGGVYQPTLDSLDWYYHGDSHLIAYHNDLSYVKKQIRIVELCGGSEIILANNLFKDYLHLRLFRDYSGSIVGVGLSSFEGCFEVRLFEMNSVISVLASGFKDCYNAKFEMSELLTAGNEGFSGCSGSLVFNFLKLTTASDSVFYSKADSKTVKYNLPALISAGSRCFHSLSSISVEYILSSLLVIPNDMFYKVTKMKKLNISSCTNIGDTVLDDKVFCDDYPELGISGETIELIIPIALMTADQGLVEGDIAILQTNNTVTIITV